MSEVFDHRYGEKTENIKQNMNSDEQKDIFSLEQESENRMLQKSRKNLSHGRKENADKINEAATKLHSDAFELIEDILARRQVLCEKEELCDFAAFIGENSLEAMDLLTLYMGEDEELTGMDRIGALDKMRGQMMDLFPESIEPCSDEVITENAGELENLAWRTAAFDRLSEKYDYLKQLSPQKKKQLTDKLSKLRIVAGYYLIRKDLMTDPDYIADKGDGGALAVKTGEIKMLEKNLQNKDKFPARKLMERYYDQSDMMKLAGDLISKSMLRKESLV